MGAAMGFAATQPPAMALTVFAALALGMATPYLLLTLFPRLLARLPRPGAWMERFRQAMAFPMFATCIWLLWVLGQQVDIHVLAQVLAGLLVLALAAWAFGLHQRGVRGWRWVAGAALAAGVYVVVGALAAGDAERSGGAGGAAAATVPGTGAAAAPAAAWGEWSPERVRELASAGTPVFVDFTAAWCVTCQVNKRMVLQRATVTEAFAARGVVRLRADWTQRDDRITAELARFGRNGVPVYVLFDAAGRPKLLPEVLTERVVLDALGTLTPAS
jgi:thiol:disulfide interchange protein DsbD